MVRLLAAALIAFSALSASPAVAQDLLTEDAQVSDITPDHEERAYPTSDGSAKWRVVKGLGNCCETYLATDAEGRLFDYGGNYVNVSADRGESWTEVRQPVQMLGGEGAIVAGPNGDMYGVGWDPYTGDTLVSMRYTPATGKWQTARMPLHSPFYDREWIAYVPGPITIDGDTFPFVLFPLRRLPSKRTSPLQVGSTPARQLTVVVLPAPFSPKMTAVSPSSTENEIPCRTGSEP